MAKKSITLNAKGVYYKQFNEAVRQALRDGCDQIVMENVNGQRYIASAVDADVDIRIQGVPGQDLAAFMRGPRIFVDGNAQDGVGNTMDNGRIVINGQAGDVLGYAMRGGSIFVRGDVGYRVGIHMKAYKEMVPTIVVGGKAGDFLGEYMAGGIILLLGMFSDKSDAPITGRSLGTGMHGGVIYVRGEVPEYQLGPGLAAAEAGQDDLKVIEPLVREFADHLDKDAEKILAEPFVKIAPYTHRPYGNMYVPT